MVALFAAILTFLTWLVLSFSQAEPVTRVAGSAAVFVSVGLALTQYVLTCLRRHCRHRHESGNCHPQS